MTSFHHSSRSFFAGRVQEFLATEPEQIIGRMSGRLAEVHRSADRDQIRAWARQIELLTKTFRDLGEGALDWSILFEMPLLRLGRRLDVVVLMSGVVALVEFKINATAYRAGDIAQTEFYALSLRDFHAASQDRIIVPILCAEFARSSTLETAPFISGVTQTLLVNAEDLAEALGRAKQLPGGCCELLTAHEFEQSPYRPTPTIIEAARALSACATFERAGRYRTLVS